MTRTTPNVNEGRLVETSNARLLSRWAVDCSSGRPALRLAWHAADAAPLTPVARAA